MKSVNSVNRLEHPVVPVLFDASVGAECFGVVLYYCNTVWELHLRERGTGSTVTAETQCKQTPPGIKVVLCVPCVLRACIPCARGSWRLLSL